MGKLVAVLALEELELLCLYSTSASICALAGVSGVDYLYCSALPCPIKVRPLTSTATTSYALAVVSRG